MIILNRLQVSRFKQLKEIDLRFPEKGTVLIEGHNESGKSSLFEAVIFALYGQPLINDRDYKIEDLKQYGAEEMEVILDFTVNGRAFNITRRFGKRHSAKLLFPSGMEGEPESITVLTEIDKRLNEEMRLSFDALLNTCFVEQKRLERLEDLNPNARQETINELLNLKVLTRLQSEFKVTREDKNALQWQKSRVDIAELDDLWPRLQSEAELAVRCQLWAKWHGKESHESDLEKQFSNTKVTETTLVSQRVEIEEQLSETLQLRNRLNQLQGETRLSLQAWKEAQNRYLHSQERVKDLQEIKEQLPALEKRGQEDAQLALRLEELEQAEQQAQVLKADEQNARAALEERGKLETAFVEKNRLNEQLENERAQAQSTLGDAEEVLKKHQETRDRINLLQVWIARQEKLQAAQERREEAAKNLQFVQKETVQFEAAKKDLTQLQSIREQIVVLTEIEQRIAQEEQRHLLQSKSETAIEQLQKEESLYAHAKRELKEIQQRIALENWEKGWHESNRPAVSPLEELKTREEKTQESLQTAEREITEKTRTQQMGWAFLGAAFVALLVGFALKISLVGGGLALVLAIIGGWVLFNAMRSTRLAREEHFRWHREIDALKGERRALESQAEIAVQQHLAEPERALQSLGITVPNSVEEARGQIIKLPQKSLEVAREEFAQHESSVRAASVQSGIDARTLEEYQSTLGENSTGIPLVKEEWETKRETARLLLESLARGIADPELHGLLKTVRDGGDLRLQSAVEAAQNRFNCARTAKEELSEKERVLQSAQSAHQAATHEYQEILERLRGNALAEGEARAEIAHLQAEQGSEAEETLAAQVVQARAALDELQSRISGLAVQLQEQRERLESAPQAELSARLKQVESQQKVCESTLEELRALRTNLQERELPGTYAALTAFLAGQREKLRQAQQEATQLASALEDEADSRGRILSAQAQFGQSWQQIFPEEEVSPDLETAVTVLPQQVELLKSKLAERDEERLRIQLMHFQEQLREIQDHLAKLQHQQSAVQEEIASLQQKLCVAEMQNTDEFLEANPELGCASERTATEWEEVVYERRQAAADNRSARRTRAEAIGEEELLAGSLLNLESERARLREREEAIAVKVRAGEIVEETRASIVKRVMPLTMQNIRQLLPLLTNRRYQDAEWDEERNWILIYDSQARELVRKRTFSGGARDQISLALRLAFALATLPSEHNTRPGFLFLDEPLSSFDRERTRALVDLLTRGLIRRRFSQIFLISHSESFDSALFDYRLRLEGGHITLNTLPT